MVQRQFSKMFKGAGDMLGKNGQNLYENFEGQAQQL